MAISKSFLFCLTAQEVPTGTIFSLQSHQRMSRVMPGESFRLLQFGESLTILDKGDGFVCSSFLRQNGEYWNPEFPLQWLSLTGMRRPQLVAVQEIEVFAVEG